MQTLLGVCSCLPPTAPSKKTESLKPEWPARRVLAERTLASEGLDSACRLGARGSAHVAARNAKSSALRAAAEETLGGKSEGLCLLGAHLHESHMPMVKISARISRHVG